MFFTLIVLIHINYYEYIAVEWVIIGQALYVVESITAKCRSLTARRGTSIKTLHDNRKKNHYPYLICSSNTGYCHIVNILHFATVSNQLPSLFEKKIKS